ncbi:MAG: hypothetical protein H6Q41_3730 [Deltaproteobacteria bacterium]|nr:hypothetical protein [Deltaproteobacteria bacterium]
MNVKVQSWVQIRSPNDALVMPNEVLSLIQDLRISVSPLSFEFDLKFEL